MSVEAGCSTLSNPLKKLTSTAVVNNSTPSAQYRKHLTKSQSRTYAPLQTLSEDQFTSFKNLQGNNSPLGNVIKNPVSLKTGNHTGATTRGGSKENWVHSFSSLQQQNSKSAWTSEFSEVLLNSSENDRFRNLNQPLKQSFFGSAGLNLSSNTEIPLQSSLAIDETELAKKFEEASQISNKLEKEKNATGSKSIEELWEEHQKQLKDAGLEPASLEEYQKQWEDFLKSNNISNDPYTSSVNSFANDNLAHNKNIDPQIFQHSNTDNVVENSLQTEDVYSQNQDESSEVVKELNGIDPFVEAMNLIKNGGSISKAAVLLEQSVRENPQHFEAWKWLGRIHTLLGNESRVVEALLEAVKLDSTNLDLMMDLAVSYVNQSLNVQALVCLEDWIVNSFPQYRNRFAKINERFEEKDSANDLLKMQMYFLDVAYELSLAKKRSSKVQAGLGIIMYMLKEYERSADCFRQALQDEPSNEILWNKLGAALTNAEKNTEAVSSYNRAVSLQPQYVRVRSNMAVSNINLGCFEDAAKHLLAAIDIIQNSSTSMESCESNEELWEMLRKVFLIGFQSTDLASQSYPGANTSYIRAQLSDLQGWPGVELE
ncbi:Peroxisomal targeting signal receptor [Schizosaccharomyces pombe]